MDISDVCRVREDGVEVDLQVSPKSSRSGIEGIDIWRRRLVVRVRAPPLEGRANGEVEEVLRGITGFSTQVISGHTSRQKTAFICGESGEICAKLNAEL